MQFGNYIKSLAKAYPVWRKYNDATMIRRLEYMENLSLAERTIENLKGTVVECGTWRGGMAAGLVEMCGLDRDYWFFDSFEGLPPAQEDVDGAAAVAYQANVHAPNYFDNCAASLEEFNATVSKTGIPKDRLHVVKGFFEDVFPSVDTAAIGPIAVLRLDVDWYHGTTLCLEKFWDNVVEGGIVLFDDYYVWDGCTRAINEFLARAEPPQQLRQGRLARGAYLIKATKAA
jgi:O-methyltransferase